MSGVENTSGVAVEIGGMPILLRTTDPAFRRMLEGRYSGFIGNSRSPRFSFDIDLQEIASDLDSDADVDVHMENGRWLLRRGDFHAEWDPESACGRVRQSANPYAIDSVLRIVHTLILAREGGFLAHA